MFDKGEHLKRINQRVAGTIIQPPPPPVYQKEIPKLAESDIASPPNEGLTAK
jgi:hypothetical protein